ncbi:hypothetical protein UB31_35040 [Bradyrhizobium sp. LTSP849]|uniref:hypothetical protein n=1 Tax=Bradyrhizobium sp. LTSP849 TaxID=1615890 RepID=UPI0005D20A4E|nr:hypothetical protein [Bradyrhizobium sp. LTSP849]KJC37443.1 hypothetical protein UB31_35040 [Bradyrhizobium sp. LTSP849]
MLLKRFANAVAMLLVASGLLLAPLATPVLAAPVSGMTDAAMPTMSTDMPCCPDQSKDCQSCPVLALCLLSISLPAPSGIASLIARNPLQRAPAVNDDLLIDGLGANPPDHPPRTLV